MIQRGTAVVGKDSLVVTMLYVIAVAAVLFAAVVLLTGRVRGLELVEPDLAGLDLPEDRRMNGEDVRRLRFSLVVRGYRMAEVDQALERLALELHDRDVELAHREPHVAAAPPTVAAPPERPEAVRWSEPEPATEPAAAPDPGPVEALPTYAALVPAEPTIDDNGEDGPAVNQGVTTTGRLNEGAASASFASAWQRSESAPVPLVAPTGDPVDLSSDEPSEEPDVPSDQPSDEASDDAVETSDETDEEPAVEEAQTPIYDPHAVRPASRFTQPPSWIEVDEAPDHDEELGTEHHTGYAPIAGVPTLEPALEPDREPHLEPESEPGPEPDDDKPAWPASS